ncbi:MAG: periplasmic heavy metal sensor [Candidatus Accumulibacter sp.]|nr:periplasmic heavy metal sensor [Accumulibacter sp.]
MKRFANLRTLAVFAAVLTLSLGLVAGGSLASQKRGGHHGMEPGGPGGPGAAHAHALSPTIFHQRGLTRLHDELKLDARQETLWKEAWDFGREQHDATRERLRKDHAEIKALIEPQGADLRAVAKRVDESRAEGQKQRDAARERWFAVYDSLDAEQKEKARLFFKAGMERTPRFGDKDRGGPGRGHQGRGHQERGHRGYDHSWRGPR